jgi:hypothetical protein
MAGTCGAKTRSGKPCANTARRANGRCRMHGGTATGPRKPNSAKNAIKAGSLYSAHLTDAEKLIVDAMQLGSVDQEIRLTRIRLMRALKREEDFGNIAELDSTVEREGAENVSAKFERHSKVRDYAGLIDRLTGRIAMLEKTRKELSGDDSDDTIKGFDITIRRAVKIDPAN